MTDGLSDDHSGSLVTVASFQDAIRRVCAAELAAGRSILETDPQHPSKLIEIAPGGRRFIVELEGEEGARTFRRLSEIPPRNS